MFSAKRSWLTGGLLSAALVVGGQWAEANQFGLEVQMTDFNFDHLTLGQDLPTLNHGVDSIIQKTVYSKPTDDNPSPAFAAAWSLDNSLTINDSGSLTKA